MTPAKIIGSEFAEEAAEAKRWFGSVYPWDGASCGCCMAFHTVGVCPLPGEHAEFAKEAKRLLGHDAFPSSHRLSEIRPVAVKLRERFDRCYRTAPEPKRSLWARLKSWWLGGDR